MAGTSRRRPRLRLKSMAWLSLALAPTLLSIAIPAAVLWRSGEFASILTSANRQLEGESLLVGPAYKGGGSKAITCYARPWDIIAIGTSRTLQFRRQFFRDETRFFNAGLEVSNLEGFLPFIENAPPDHRPKVLIVCLDQYFFNDKWAKEHRGWTVPPTRPENFLESFGQNLAMLERSWRSVWTDLWTRKVTIDTITRDHYGKIELIGLTARTYLGGTRDDGSYRYGRRIASPDDPELEDHQFQDTFERIKKGRRRFEYGQEISPQSLVLLDQFLTRARELGIEVIGLLPPYANVAWDRMMHMGNKYEYLRVLPSAVGTAFERHGMKLYDFSALRDVGATDEEALDGFHAGEKAMARATVLMARDHPSLRKYVDPDKLERAIQAAPDPVEVFPLEPLNSRSPLH